MPISALTMGGRAALGFDARLTDARIAWRRFAANNDNVIIKPAIRLMLHSAHKRRTVFLWNSESRVVEEFRMLLREPTEGIPAAGPVLIKTDIISLDTFIPAVLPHNRRFKGRKDLAG